MSNFSFFQEVQTRKITTGHVCSGMTTENVRTESADNRQHVKIADPNSSALKINNNPTNPVSLCSPVCFGVAG